MLETQEQKREEKLGVFYSENSPDVILMFRLSLPVCSVIEHPAEEESLCIFRVRTGADPQHRASGSNGDESRTFQLHCRV